MVRSLAISEGQSLLLFNEQSGVGSTILMGFKSNMPSDKPLPNEINERAYDEILQHSPDGARAERLRLYRLPDFEPAEMSRLNLTAYLM